MGSTGPRDDVGRDHLALEHDGLADPGLGGLEAVGQDLFGDLGRALLVVLAGALRAAGLDHHDGDLGVVGLHRARPATTSSKVDSSPSSKVGWGIHGPSVE